MNPIQKQVEQIHERIVLNYLMLRAGRVLQVTYGTDTVNLELNTQNRILNSDSSMLILETHPPE